MKTLSRPVYEPPLKSLSSVSSFGSRERARAAASRRSRKYHSSRFEYARELSVRNVARACRASVFDLAESPLRNNKSCFIRRNPLRRDRTLREHARSLGSPFSLSFFLLFSNRRAAGNVRRAEAFVRALSSARPQTRRNRVDLFRRND